MNKIITAGCVAVAAFAAVAMPNKRELADAQRIVEDVTKADLAAFKAGKKPAKDVADAHISLAEKVENQAEKYLLYQGAFKLYARCEEYDLAADALRDMQREVKDVPPEVIAEIVGDELRYVPDAKAPQLVAVLKEAKGKKPTADDADEKLYLDVVAELRRKGGNEKERANIVLSKLFPGWTLAAGERIGDTGGFVASHRGKNNVFYSHPISRELPMILSREMKLPVKNPCLFLTVSSFDQKSDCLLTVRVNGKDALPARRINTLDNAPWEDVVVPLSAWSGQKVKIELVHSANNWYCEHLYLSRIKIAEGSDGAQVVEGKATVDGYTWSYRVKNGEAEIVSEKDGKRSCAVSPNPKGHLAIPSTIEGVKVTSIGRDAFSGCRALTAVTIPESVTSIGRGAFFNCGLKSVVIPSGVKSMSLDVFMGCGELSSVTIPSGVSCIEESTFNLCHVLKSVVIPVGVKRIGRCAFQECGFRSITIPASVTSVEQWAFRRCHELTAVTMLGERPDVSNDVFSGCDKLTAIHVPANAKSWAGMKEWQGKPLVFDEKIDTSGFDHEEDPQEAARKAVATLFPGWSLDTEIAPNPRGGFCDSHRGEDNVMYIHPKAEGASAIVSRTLKLSDKNPCLFLKTASWAESVLAYECDFILSVRVNGKEVLPKRIICTPDYEPWKDIVIPLGKWRGHKVKVEVVLTANGWWHEFPLFKRLEIAEGTGEEKFVAEARETVGDYTWSYRVDDDEAEIVSEKDGGFSYAVSPSPKGRIVIPSTLGGVKVTSIGRNAFRDCKGLKSVTIPVGVTNLGRDSFAGCENLAVAVLPSTVANIGRGAFGNCGNLSSVALPSGVKNIGMWAFADCRALKSIRIPPCVKVVKGGAFQRCSGLTSLTIPSGVTIIGDETFNGNGAFRGCSALTSVTIPSSTENIEKTAFCDMGALTSFRVRGDNRFYKAENGLLLTKDGTTLVHGVNGDVTIPSSVTNISDCAFEGCSSLRSIRMPSGVRSIGGFAFKNCGALTSVTIPENVKSIGCEAFHGCVALTAVTLLGERSDIHETAFRGCDKLTAIHVPASAKSWAGMKEWQGKPLVFDAK